MKAVPAHPPKIAPKPVKVLPPPSPSIEPEVPEPVEELPAPIEAVPHPVKALPHKSLHPAPLPHPLPHPKPVHHLPAPYNEIDHYEDGPSNYAFGYSVNDEYTGEDFSHTEIRDGYTTSGEYRVALPDGRIQIVTYTADENGYHADVKYEGVAVPNPIPPPLNTPPHPPPVAPTPLPHIPPKPTIIVKPTPLPPAPLPHIPPTPSIGYPKSLPDIKKHAPLPAKFLPTPPSKYHHIPKYTPAPRHYAPTPKYLPKALPRADYLPLKSIHLKPAVYKPKPDPYAAKIGGYFG